MKILLLTFLLFALPIEELYCQTAIPFDSLLEMSTWKFARIEALLKKCGFTTDHRSEDPNDVFASRVLSCKQVIPPTEDGAKEIVRTFYFNESNNSIHTFLHTEILYLTSSAEEEEEIRKYLKDHEYYEERKYIFNNGKKHFSLNHIREVRNKKVLESLKLMMKVKRPKPMRRHLESR